VDDLDRARQALAAVGIDLDALLNDPAIPRIEGNPAKARLLFCAPTGEPIAARKLSLPGLNGRPVAILELRAGPVQDLLPPSLHPLNRAYRFLRAPWDTEEVPEPPAALLDLWRRWDELLPRMLAALNPETGQGATGPAEQAVREYRTRQGQGTGDAWEEVRRQIRARLPLADQLARMEAQQRGQGRYSCPFHPPDRTPSFWLHGDLWVCAHGGAPVGFTSRKTGYGVGDVVDLYQHSRSLDSPGKAAVELARELGVALPEEKPCLAYHTSLLAGSFRSQTNSKTDPDSGPVSRLPGSGCVVVSPVRGGNKQTAAFTRQTVADLRAAYTPTRWAVEGLLPQPGILLLAGIPGIGKTWLDLTLALAVAAGSPWLNRFQARQGPVLLVLEEEDASAVLERLDLLYAGLGLSQEAGDALPVHFLIQQGVSLVTEEGTLGPELLRHVQEVRPTLAVLDPFRRVHGLDENDSGQMSGLFNLLRGLTQATEPPCSLLLVHHLRKRSEHPEDTLDRLRGSSDIAASVDSVLEVGGQFGNLVVKHSKSKRGPALGTFLVLGEVSPQAVRLCFVDHEVKAESDREALRTWLLETLRRVGPQNLSQLSKAGKPQGYGRARISRRCEELAAEGALLIRPGRKNSKLYALGELLFEGGAGAENNNSENEEIEVVL
jgi:hypothetical protein